MAELWYFTCEGKQMEPVTADELKQLARSGFLRATDMVWKDGMSAWSTAGDVPDLIPASAAAADVPVAKSSRSAEPARSLDDDFDDARPRRRRRPDDQDERVADDAPRRRREPAKKGMSGLTLTLIIVGVLVGVVGIIGGIIAYAVHANAGKVISTYDVNLKPNSSDSREFAFQFGTLYQFNVKSDLQTDVDLVIENNQGQAVAGDWSEGPNSFLRWSPTATGNYRVKVNNLDFNSGNRSWVTIRSMGSSRGPVGNGVPFPIFNPQPENKFPNRSQAVQAAIRDKLHRMKRSRLARECAKLDPVFEQALADEGLSEDSEQWPEY